MKTMSRETMDKVVSEHFVYEATDDIEGVLRTFTDDALHEVIGGPDGRCEGRLRFGTSTSVCSRT